MTLTAVPPYVRETWRERLRTILQAKVTADTAKLIATSPTAAALLVASSAVIMTIAAAIGLGIALGYLLAQAGRMIG